MRQKSSAKCYPNVASNATNIKILPPTGTGTPTLYSFFAKFFGFFGTLKCALSKEEPGGAGPTWTKNAKKLFFGPRPGLESNPASGVPFKVTLSASIDVCPYRRCAAAEEKKEEKRGGKRGEKKKGRKKENFFYVEISKPGRTFFGRKKIPLTHTK